MKNKAVKKICKLLVIISLLCLCIWIFYPYVQVERLTREYGDYFEEGYRQISFFEKDPYMKPRVLRYQAEKARIATDSGFLKIMLEDERENIAVVNYSGILAVVFINDGEGWRVDGNEKCDRFIMLQSATADNVIWPFYLW